MSYPFSYNIGLIFHRLTIVSSIFALFFILIETIKPGFIVHFTYIVPYILFTILMGIGSLIFYRKPRIKRGFTIMTITIAAHLIFSILLGVYIVKLLTLENDNSLLIGFLTGFIYFVHTLLFLNSQEKFLNKVDNTD